MLKRSPLKKSNTPLSRGTGLKKTSKLKAKVKTQEEKDQQKKDIEKMWTMFREIYQERGPYSEISGEYLGPEPLSWMFDHLLEKSRYPEIKYEKWNILMVTFAEHSAKTNGYPLDAHVIAIEKAKEKYGIN